MPFRLDDPQFLWLLGLAVPIVWLGKRSLVSVELDRKWTAISLRLVVLAILVLMLCGFEMVRWHNDLTVVAVVDRSESIDRFATPPKSAIKPETPAKPATVGQWVDRWLTESWQQRQRSDRLGFITYDGRPTVRSMSSSALDLEGGIIHDPRQGTDSAEAIRAAMAWFPTDSSKRMVLVSDGNDTVWHGAEAGSAEGSLAGTAGDLLTAASEAAAAGIPIDVLPIRYRLENEVMVQTVAAPVDARKGRTIVVKVVLRATRPTPGVLHLLHDGLDVDIDEAVGRPDGRIEAADWTTQIRDAAKAGGVASVGATSGGDDYMLVKRISVRLSDSGANRFEATFEPDKGRDSSPRNNSAQAFTLVHGKGSLLVLDGVGGDSGRVLPDALNARGLDTHVVPADAMPTTLADLQRYDAIVLQNVPSEMVSTEQQKMIVKYVTDLGGGLVMIGGPDSFGAGAWTNTPIDNILPVTCELPKQKVMPSGALVIVLDRSGSMQSPVMNSRWNKQEIANQSAVLAIQTLLPQDMVGVVAFSSASQWVYPIQLYEEPDKVAKLVLSIQPGGGTKIYDALANAANELASVTDANVAIKHIVMLTDGQGAGGDYETLLRDMRHQGITLSTIAVGDGADADLLAWLATDGGGAFYPIVDPNDLPQIFIKEARHVRKSLIREVPFNPQIVPTGSPIMAGITRAPRLRGMVLTGPREDGRVFMPILGPQGEPLFAHWQVGLGRVAAFTSDATNRWASHWLDWAGYSDFWARTMRGIARPSASRQFDLLAAIERKTLRIRLDTAGTDQRVESAVAGISSRRRGDSVRVEGAVVMPDGSTKLVKLDATGPGVYEAAVPAPAQGNYIVSLFMQDDAGRRQYVFGGANKPAGAELRFFASNTTVLEEVATITNGRFLDPVGIDAAALFARDDTTKPSRSIRPVWRLLLGWLFALFLLDVAARRIAWNFGAVTTKATGLLKTRQVQAQPTLDALKRRSAQLDRKLDRQPSRTEAQARFEATAETGDDTGLLDLDRVAAEMVDETDAPDQDQEAPAAPSAASETTGRLLDAKRRARERLDQNDQEESDHG